MTVTRQYPPGTVYDCRTGQCIQSNFLTYPDLYGPTNCASTAQIQQYSMAQLAAQTNVWPGVLGSSHYGPPKAGKVSPKQPEFLLEAWKEIECGIFYKTEEEAEQSFRENF
jgi:hypothetical protein